MSDLIVKSVFILLGCASAEARKVAILVQASRESPYSAVDQAFTNLRSADEQLYRRAGYEVVYLRPGAGEDKEPTAENLARQLETLRETSDVQVSFIGHGEVTNQFPGSPFDAKRYPPFSLGPDEDFITARDPSAERPVQMYLPMQEGHSIGAGDLKSALGRMRDKNPAAMTTVTLINCYGGAFVRELANTPRTQAFAGTTRDRPGHVVRDQDVPREFAWYFNRALGRGETYAQAFVSAQTDFIDTSFLKSATDPTTAGFPRNQVGETLADWCAGADARTASASSCTNCRRTDDLARVRRAEALIAARAGPRAAITQVDQIEASPECNSTVEELASASGRLKTRAVALSAPLRKEWINAVKRLTEADLSRLRSAAALLPVHQSLEDLQKKLMDTEFSDINLTAQFIPLDMTNTFKSILAGRTKCGLINGVRGDAWLISPVRASEVYGKALDCIEGLNASPFVQHTLAQSVLAPIKDLASAKQRCEGLDLIRRAAERDLRCADRFAKDARDEDWARLEELFTMGERKVVSR